MTQPHPIPHSVKIEAYFWAGTAKEIAALLAQLYGQRSFTGAHLIDAWTEESAWNVLLRDERPASGFDPDKREIGLRLLREMRAAA